MHATALNRRAQAWLLACACGAALLTVSPAPAHANDPTRADAPVPALHHESALRHYRALGPTPPLSWQQANERVNRIGGWRAYTRETHAPDPAPQTAPATPAPRKENGHAHH